VSLEKREKRGKGERKIVYQEARRAVSATREIKLFVTSVAVKGDQGEPR
jgi:hypothetical protein